MDQHNKETSPGTQSSRKTPGFKIPKKKPDDWCEDIQASSPLSRLQDDVFRNVSIRRAGRSSYEEYNVPRNKTTLKFDRPPRFNDFSEQYQEREIGSKYEARSPVDCKDQTQESPSSKVCRDVSNTSISSGPRKSSSLDQESQGASKVQEQKSALKGNETSPARREKTYCCKRAEHQSKKISLSPSSTDPSSSSTEPFTDRTCILESPGRKNITRPKMKETTEENKKSSDDGCSSDTQRFRSQPGAYSRTRSKMLFATNDSVGAPPIVLSSDEDEAAQKETKPGCSHTVKKTTEQQKNPSPTKDAEPMEHSGILEDAISAPEQSDSPALQLKLFNIYYGKRKGKATESAKFTATSIEIPLKVPLHKITCLSVETRKLQKYGLWLTKGSDLVRSSAVIILWMTPDYVPSIERQMEMSAKNQGFKSNEFIFLELAEPFTSKEQSLMSEIMVEASKHGSPSLAEVFIWEEMFSMLESLPFDECSFKLNCYSAGSQPPEAKKVKSTYKLMQKWSDGQFSLSMVPEQHGVLGEAHRSGVPIRLLVYPPPPTKGGLAVSNEDLDCLEHGEFLNDVIIDFYLKYLMLEIFPKPFADRCHIFSSFFFKCLTRKENSSSDNPDISTAERRHQSVKNWTRHVDIFTKDFIFVPVNENSHWYLAVICFPWLEKAVYEDKKEEDVVPHSKTKDRSSSGSVIVFNDRLSKTEEAIEDSNSGSEGSCSSGPNSNRRYPKPKESHIGKVCKRPCILIFDSLTTGSVRTTVQVLRDYLKVECRVKNKSEREFSRSSMRELHPKVPKQNNSTDCGLYLLQYVESFSKKPVENFESPLHLENWFPSCAVRDKREEIRDLILRLHVEQTKKKS